MLRSALDRRVESELPAEKHLLVRTGDIAYNTMRMWQGASGLATYDCMVSPAYVVITPGHCILSEFAEIMLSSRPIIRLLHGYSQGIVDDRLRLYYRDFCEIWVNLPPLPLQHEITAHLNSLQGAIAAEEPTLSSTLTARRRIAADLLTGRVRVPA